MFPLLHYIHDAAIAMAEPRRSAALAVGCLAVAACTSGSQTMAVQTRTAARGALDSAAAWQAPMRPEFYHGLRGWVFRPQDSTPLGIGPRSITAFSAKQPLITTDSAVEGQLLSVSPNGSHVGRMKLEGEQVVRFELRTAAGKLLWAHDSRGHHYYQVGPEARLTVGHTSTTSHPGKPGSVGTVTFYDSRGNATGDFACSRPGGSEISPDGTVLLLECRDSALVLLDPRGGTLAGLPGSFRNFRVAAEGRVITAVPLARPRSLTIVTRDPRSRSPTTGVRELSEAVRQVTMTPDGALIAVTAGAEVIGLSPDASTELWRVKLEGPAPIASSLAVGRDGLVVVGALLDGSRALGGAPGPHPAMVAAIQGGRVLRITRFELESLNAWVPSVALDPNQRFLLVWDPTTIWSIDVPRWLKR